MAGEWEALNRMGALCDQIPIIGLFMRIVARRIV